MAEPSTTPRPYFSTGRRTILVLEFAHLWAQVQDMPGNEAEASSEAQRFNLFAEQHPDLAKLAKRIQFDAFDRVNAL